MSTSIVADEFKLILIYITSKISYLFYKLLSLNFELRVNKHVS